MEKKEFNDILFLLQSLSRLNEVLNDFKRMDSNIKKIETEVSQIKDFITDYSSSKFLDNWIPLELACDKLGISKRTFYNLRSEGKITFVQPTPKRIFIEKSEIKRFLDNSRIERFKTK